MRVSKRIAPQKTKRTHLKIHTHKDILSKSDDRKTTQPNDLALLVGRDGKSFVLRLKPEGKFHTHRGSINHNDLIGLPWGTGVSTHLGFPLLLLRPSLDDLVCNLKRSTQIVYPKDAGYILMKLNLGPGRRVIEAGTGSGGLTLVLANAVGKTGRVFTYDNRSEMQELARQNLEQVGLDEQVTFKTRDVAQGFDERDADAVFLDLPTPWDYLQHVHRSLVSGGFFGCLVPTTNQVSRLIRALDNHAFGMIEVEELLLRPYKTVPARLRPEDRLVPHTGYLIFARTFVPPSPSLSERPSRG